MEKVNQFYSTYDSEENKHEFDIRKLGEETFRGFSPTTGRNAYGNRYGGDIMQTSTTQNDYDNEFVKKLINIKPAYRVDEFLNFHFQFYKTETGNEELFVKQIEYVILPRIKLTTRTGYIQITKDWLTKIKKMVLQKLLNEKNMFLKKAYEVAYEEDPSSPFSVDINPIELGKVIGLSEISVERIMTELVQDGFVHSSLGMGSLLVTNHGLKYLQGIEFKNNNKDMKSSNFKGTIFLSYSWSNKDIADIIDKDFIKNHIVLKRDERNVAYRKSIKDFMNQLGKSNFVLMIISDEYLKK